jgi:hypothetical protein
VSREFQGITAQDYTYLITDALGLGLEFGYQIYFATYVPQKLKNAGGL